MSSLQSGNNPKVSKLPAPNSTWSFKESGINSGSFNTFDDGHEEQRINTGTRAYFDQHGGTVKSLLYDVLKLTNFQSIK